MAESFKKPSFLSSTWSGIKGYVKGALAGGLIGILTGAVIGAVVGIFSPGAGLEIFSAVGGSVAPGMSGIAAGAIGMGAAGGSALATVGALAGTVTGVVKSRETATPSAQDVVNLAKVTFSQGVAVGHQIGHEQATAEISTKWRDKIAQQRGQQLGNTTQQV